MKKNKKSRLLTYFLSFIPGVGYMYRGWMKKGFSYLTLFLCVVSGLTWLNINILMIIPVLIWFYAFFDQINTFSLSEEESKGIEDEVIFHSYITRLNQDFIKNHHGMVGGLLMILGGYLFVKNVYFTLILVLPKSIQVTLHSMMDHTPQLILACLILYCGVCFLQENPHLIAMFHKSEKQRVRNKQEETLIAKTNVVYYMEKGKIPNSGQEQFVARIDEGENIEAEEKTREQEAFTRKKDEYTRRETYITRKEETIRDQAEHTRDQAEHIRDHHEPFRDQEEPIRDQEESIRDQDEIIRREERHTEDEEQSFAEILEQVSREQLLRKARALLDDEIYQAIHIESAPKMEESKAVNDTKQEI